MENVFGMLFFIYLVSPGADGTLVNKVVVGTNQFSCETLGTKMRGTEFYSAKQYMFQCYKKKDGQFCVPVYFDRGEEAREKRWLKLAEIMVQNCNNVEQLKQSMGGVPSTKDPETLDFWVLGRNNLMVAYSFSNSDNPIYRQLYHLDGKIQPQVSPGADGTGTLVNSVVVDRRRFSFCETLGTKMQGMQFQSANHLYMFQCYQKNGQFIVPVYFDRGEGAKGNRWLKLAEIMVQSCNNVEQLKQSMGGVTTTKFPNTLGFWVLWRNNLKVAYYFSNSSNPIFREMSNLEGKI